MSASQVTPFPHMKIEANTRDVRDILTTLIRFGGLVADAAKPAGSDKQKELKEEFRMGQKLWMAAEFHEGNSIELDNDLFVTFSKLVVLANTIGADLELPVNLQNRVNNMPQPAAQLNYLSDDRRPSA